MIKCIKGVTSIIADTLSYLDLTSAKSDDASSTSCIFSMIDADTDLFPLDISLMSVEQDIDDQYKERMIEKSARTCAKRAVNDTKVI